MSRFQELNFRRHVFESQEEIVDRNSTDFIIPQPISRPQYLHFMLFAHTICIYSLYMSHRYSFLRIFSLPGSIDEATVV